MSLERPSSIVKAAQIADPNHHSKETVTVSRIQNAGPRAWFMNLFRKADPKPAPDADIVREINEQIKYCHDRLQELSDLAIEEVGGEKSEPRALVDRLYEDDEDDPTLPVKEATAPYRSVYYQLVDKFSFDQEVWTAFKAYVLTMGKGEGAAKFSDAKVMNAILYQLQGDLDLQRLFYLDVFRRNGVTQVLANSNASPNLRNSLELKFTKLLLEQSPHTVELTLKYWAALPKNYLTTEVQLTYLIEYCSSRASQDGAPNIDGVMGYIQNMEKGLSPYRT